MTSTGDIDKHIDEDTIKKHKEYRGMNLRRLSTQTEGISNG